MAEGKIYEAISDVMAEVGFVGKNKKNQQGSGFMYRGIDDVMNALNPAMIKSKVFVAPEVLEQSREERLSKAGGTLIYSVCRIKYTFYTVDGSNVSAIVIGEAMDSGDKATNKAMSIAFKYACFQVFCIPTEEMQDADSETHKVEPKKAETTDKPSVNRTDLLKSFETEMLRTKQEREVVLKKLGVSDPKFIKTEKLIEFVEALKKFPTRA